MSTTSVFTLKALSSKLKSTHRNSALLLFA